MNPKRFTSTLLLGAALAGLVAADAQADSVAYVKAGDVYLSTGDGARQFQVTSGGGYTDVAQADDGTLVATTADAHLRRLDRLGAVLSDIVTPVSDHSGGVIRFQGPFDADVSPDGRTVGYGFIESGLFSDPTTGTMSAQTRNGAGFTSSSALTGFTDTGYKHSLDWDAPEFVDNQNVLLSNGPVDPYNDTIAVEQVGTGHPVNWFSDDDIHHPMEASISRNKLVIAAVDGPGRGKMVVYHDTDGKLGSTPGQPLNVEACFTYSGTGIASPTFNADGTRGYWATSDGLVTAPFGMRAGAGGCGNAVNATTLVPGATSPDWGPADVPTSRPAAPAPAPAPGPAPAPAVKLPPTPAKPGTGTGAGGAGSPTASSIKVTVRRVALRKALSSGLTITVAGGSGTAKATATVGGRTVATGRGSSARITLRFTKAARKALARKRSLTLKVQVARGGRSASTSIRLAR